VVTYRWELWHGGGCLHTTRRVCVVTSDAELCHAPPRDMKLIIALRAVNGVQSVWTNKYWFIFQFEPLFPRAEVVAAVEAVLRKHWHDLAPEPEPHEPSARQP
jgi:hypothetical protein